MIYLDNNATTPVAPEAVEAVTTHLASDFGNASSAYSIGSAAREVVEAGRRSVADLVGASSASEIVFTSGGTESDNWAIFAAVEARPDKDHIVTTRVEHEAVRKACEKLERQGRRVTRLDVAPDGSLDIDELKRALDARTALVSVMLANNETGILFPVTAIGSVVKEHSEALFHVDGVNAVGKVPLSLKNTEIDLFSMSAHKFHGPKGIGALYVRDGVRLPPSMIGGGQETGRRAGTEAVHQVAGMAAAARVVSDLSAMERVAKMRDRLEHEILDRIPNSRINGTADPEKRLPNTSSISFEGANGEAVLAMLDAAGICVSTGSACHAADHSPSTVLQAMNIPYSQAMGSIRFSLGRYNTEKEIDEVMDKLPAIVAEVRARAV